MLGISVSSPDSDPDRLLENDNYDFLPNATGGWKPFFNFLSTW